ncbi:hypothetical protein LINPERHAP2_LOCUS24869 [Linum perenne]
MECEIIVLSIPLTVPTRISSGNLVPVRRASSAAQKSSSVFRFSPLLVVKSGSQLCLGSMRESDRSPVLTKTHGKPRHESQAYGLEISDSLNLLLLLICKRGLCSKLAVRVPAEAD